MEYSVSSASLTTQRTGLLVLPVFLTRRLHETTQTLDEASDGYIQRALERRGFNGQRAENLLLLEVPNIPAERVLLIGCGRRRDIDARRFVSIAEQAARAMADCGAEDAISCLSQIAVKRRDSRWRVRQLLEANEAYNYRPDGLKSSLFDKKLPPLLHKITFSLAKPGQFVRGQTGCTEGIAINQGIALARYLGNLPGNICTPEYLADQACQLTEQHASLETNIVDEAELQELGMGALLAVSRGSHEPACLITMTYNGGMQNQAPIILIGKGITFDSGGLSLKPAGSMVDMKFDMCGAASVFGAMLACIQLALPINVIGVVVAAENMPGPKAIKPGDIITTLSGRTVEITNTDAEGRLALCDALTYVKRFKPDTVIDIATLTGACRVALGRHLHGLFSNSRSLGKELVTAGRRSHDRVWQMPLMAEYEGALRSKYADMVNMGGQSAGAIVAACFLSRFTRNMRWAHLDVAATASDATHKGATGRPVALLTQYLIDRAQELKH